MRTRRPPCRAIIFDFDGVIVESEHIKSRAFAALYAEYGRDVADAVVAHHEQNGGVSRRKKIRYCHRTLLGREVGDEELEALCRRFSSLVEGEVVDCLWVPGARGVIESQATLRLLFVVSGTPHEELGRIVMRRGLASFFTEVWGSPPEKAVTVEGILSRHRLDRDRRSVLFVGDAVADWRAARETGVRFVGRVADGKASPFPAGTAVIRDLRQLVV
ncbi:MAG: HAD family hydrolase [Rhodospirillales bacterium]|nr:HAD family hydrolase [Rhodospirillales bacterium]